MSAASALKSQTDFPSNRRLDAIMHVKESLAARNCALVHKDDIFTDDEQRMWDTAQEFVDRFVGSDEAANFDRTFVDHLQSNIDFDKAARVELDGLQEAVAQKSARFEAAKKEYEDTVKSGKKAEITAAKQAYSADSLEERTARAAFNAAGKRLTMERKGQNKIFKPYVFTEVHWRGRRLDYADPSVLLGTAGTLLDIAGDYYGEAAKVRIPTLWRVSRVPEGVDLPRRVGSQLWHRDQGDARMLKLFAYFSDVDEGSGALEYVPSSLPKDSKWAEKIPLTANSGYPPQELVETLVPKDEIFRCIGKAGTLAFADTAGLHRGGYAVSGPRITVQTTYMREKTHLPQTPMIPPGVRPVGLTERQYWALS